MLGSSRSWGAQRGQLPRLSMSMKTLSGGASILMDRSMRKLFGLVAAIVRTSPINAATIITTLKIMIGLRLVSVRNDRWRTLLFSQRDTTQCVENHGC